MLPSPASRENAALAPFPARQIDPVRRHQIEPRGALPSPQNPCHGRQTGSRPCTAFSWAQNDWSPGSSQQPVQLSRLADCGEAGPRRSTRRGAKGRRSDAGTGYHLAIARHRAGSTRLAALQDLQQLRRKGTIRLSILVVMNSEQPSGLKSRTHHFEWRRASSAVFDSPFPPRHTATRFG